MFEFKTAFRFASSTIKTFEQIPHQESREILVGLKVLLVEDVMFNQEIAREILEGAGLIVKIASNGRQAVELLEQADYDIVLMDVQMPVMDGYEATRLIRSKGKYNQLPIIAMTAHAMELAKEECVAAGMNDYVSKPIDPEQLFSVIVKWVKFRMGSKKGMENSKFQKECIKADFLQSLPGLDIDSGLKRLNNNVDLYRKLICEFAKTYAGVVGEIRDAIAKGDLRSAEFLAHRVKGIGGNLSAYEVQHAAFKLEMGIVEKEEESYERLLLALEDSLKPVVLSAVKLETNKEARELQPNIPVDIDRISSLLEEMEHLLLTCDSDAERCLEVLKENIGSTQFQTEIKELEKYISQFDFDNAIEPLTRIALGINRPLGGVHNGAK